MTGDSVGDPARTILEMLEDSSSLSAMTYIHGFKKPMQTLRGLTTTKPMRNLVVSAFLRIVSIVLEIVQ
jgi:hypothetical protein